MKKWYKTCPFCKNEIKKAAIKCQHCKKMLPIEEKQNKSDVKVCPYCLNEVKVSAKKCPFCKELFNKETPRKQVKENLLNENKEKNVDDWDNLPIIPNRLGRFSFFLYSVCCNVVVILLMIALWQTGLDEDFLIVAMFILNLIIHVYLASKRCHDIWQSWWLWLVVLIPAAIWVLYFIPWEPVDNIYWPVPN